MRCTVDGAMPSWAGHSRKRIRRLTHRFVVALSVLFGDVLGRDERSCMGSSAR